METTPENTKHNVPGGKIWQPSNTSPKRSRSKLLLTGVLLPVTICVIVANPHILVDLANTILQIVHSLLWWI